MPVVKIDDIPLTRNVAPGWHGRFVHTDHLTVANWKVPAGTLLPAHAHPNEQVTIVMSGTFAFKIGGEVTSATAGHVAVVPSGVEHSGVAISDCELMDIFYPARQEYRISET